HAAASGLFRGSTPPPMGRHYAGRTTLSQRHFDVATADYTTGNGRRVSAVARAGGGTGAARPGRWRAPGPMAAWGAVPTVSGGNLGTPRRGRLADQPPG